LEEGEPLMVSQEGRGNQSKKIVFQRGIAGMVGKNEITRPGRKKKKKLKKGKTKKKLRGL